MECGRSPLDHPLYGVTILNKVLRCSESIIKLASEIQSAGQIQCVEKLQFQPGRKIPGRSPKIEKRCFPNLDQALEATWDPCTTLSKDY